MVNYNQSGFPTLQADGTITAYHPQYGKYYAGQKIKDVEAMLGAENTRQQQITSGSDFSGYQNQLNNLMQDPSSIQNDPSYKFRLDQGNQAINRSAAAKGMGNSGNVLAELMKYGQGMASEELGNKVNTLSNLMTGAQKFGIASGYSDKWKSKLPADIQFNTNNGLNPSAKPTNYTNTW